jgi:hypothetical protein
MAIISSGTETLVHTRSVDENITLKTLMEQSRDMDKNWKNHIVMNKQKTNFQLNDELQLVINTVHGDNRTMDITDNAFSQLCTRMGVPPKYIKKCFAAGKSDLAIENFRAWESDNAGNMLIREYNGVARAVLSDSYAPFDNYRVLRALNYTMDTKRFIPTQVYMSEDKLHIRFVDYQQLPISDGTGAPLYAGVILSSNSVGEGSLSLKFFIYRSVCRNGMAISSMGGTLFRQHHIGEKMTDSKIAVFNRAFMDIDRLTDMAITLVKENSGRYLKDYEFEMYLEKARREMKLSEKSMDKLKLLVGDGGTYEPTKWGFINGITELAQDFTLDTRYEMENWAGELFTRKAA